MVWGLKDELEDAVTIAIFPAGPAQVQVAAGSSGRPFLLSPLSSGRESEAGMLRGGEGTSATCRPLPRMWER